MTKSFFKKVELMKKSLFKGFLCEVFLQFTDLLFIVFSKPFRIRKLSFVNYYSKNNIRRHL